MGVRRIIYDKKKYVTDEEKRINREKAIDTFRSYKKKYINNIESLVALKLDNYDYNYFRRHFRNYFDFLEYFNIREDEFENAKWFKWNHMNIYPSDKSLAE